MSDKKLQGKKFSLASFGGVLGEMVLDKFEYNCQHANEKQKTVLERLIKQGMKTEYGKKYHFDQIKTLEDYRRLVPFSEYEDYADAVERMTKGEKNIITAKGVRRFVDTTGSTGKPKIIPLSYWSEWICHIFGFCAPIGCCKRYYESQGRNMPGQHGFLTIEANIERTPTGKTISGIGMVPFINLKPITRFYSPVPMDVLFPENTDKFDTHYIKCRFTLAEPDISFIGCIYINAMEGLLAYIEENWELLVDDIEKGTIDESINMPDKLRAKLLKKIKPDPQRAAQLRKEFEKGFDDSPIVPRIWPKCEWVYGISTSSGSHYYSKLRRYIGEDMPMHHGSYSASEAMMGVPTEMNSDEYVLLPQNGFFEFRDVAADDGYDNLKTISELEVGKDYEIILTNMSGFYRYLIRDVVKCVGYYYEAPRVRFSYRLGQIASISCEKITMGAFEELIEKMQDDVGVEFNGYSIHSDFSTDPGHFTLFVEIDEEVTDERRKQFLDSFEKRLEECNAFVATNRQTKQLGESEIKFVKKGSYAEFTEILAQRTLAGNQVKPVRIIDNNEKYDFFTARLIK